MSSVTNNNIRITEQKPSNSLKHTPISQKSTHKEVSKQSAISNSEKEEISEDKVIENKEDYSDFFNEYGFISITNSFSIVFPKFNPSNESNNDSVNMIIKDMVNDIVEKAPVDEKEKEEKEDLLRILKVIRNSNQLNNTNIHTGQNKNSNLFHMQQIMKCMMSDLCQLPRILSTIEKKLKMKTHKFDLMNMAQDAMEGSKADDTEETSEANADANQEQEDNIGFLSNPMFQQLKGPAMEFIGKRELHTTHKFDMMSMAQSAMKGSKADEGPEPEEPEVQSDSSSDGFMNNPMFEQIKKPAMAFITSKFMGGRRLSIFKQINPKSFAKRTNLRRKALRKLEEELAPEEESNNGAFGGGKEEPAAENNQQAAQQGQSSGMGSGMMGYAKSFLKGAIMSKLMSMFMGKMSGSRILADKANDDDDDDEKSPWNTVKEFFSNTKNKIMGWFMKKADGEITENKEETIVANKKHKRILTEVSTTATTTTTETHTVKQPVKANTTTTLSTIPCKDDAKESESKEPEQKSWWTKLMDWFKNLFSKKSNDTDKKRILSDEVKDDPIELFSPEFENEYYGVLDSLDEGYTNEDLKTTTNEYIALLKKNLLNVKEFGAEWVMTVTDTLDQFRNHLNENELTLDNFNEYLENLREAWKEEAFTNIDSESSIQLNTMAESVDDFEARVAKKMPESNALVQKINKFLTAYKFKLKEYGKFLDDEDKRETMKNQLGESIDNMINKTIASDDEKSTTINLYNDLKKDVNTKLYKSLNAKNLNYILHNTIVNMIEDLEGLQNPENESGFVMTKEELSEFTEKVKAEIKNINKGKGVTMHTESLQKMLDSGTDLLENMESEDKKIDLEKVESTVVADIRAVNEALEDVDVQEELHNLVTDYVDYERLRKNFDLSGVKRSELYEFLTKDINTNQSDLPTRLLHQLNKRELLVVDTLSRDDRQTLEFVRKLLIQSIQKKSNKKNEKQFLKRTLSVMLGNSSENVKFSQHKFDMAGAVGKFKSIYSQLTGTVDSGLKTSTGLNNKLESGQHRFSNITDKLNISSLVSGDGFLNKMKGWFSFGNKKEGARVLMDISSFKDMYNKLNDAHDNSITLTNNIQSARDMTKKFEDGFEILKKFA